MSKVQMLRASVNQRLTAAAEEIFVLFERTIAEYEEELSRSKEENERQRKLLDAVFKPQLHLHRAVITADVQQLLESKEDVRPEKQERSTSPDQPPHIKQEEEVLWTSQEGEQLQELEEVDITKFIFTPVPPEDDEEKPQSSQLHQTLTEENKDLVICERTSNSDPDRHLLPDTDHRSSDYSEAEVRDDLWTEISEPQAGLDYMSNIEALISDMKCNPIKKQHKCFECGKIFKSPKCLKRHLRIHTGEKDFKCSFCDKAFVRKEGLTQHVRLHTGEKPFSCSVCDRRFTWQAQVKHHHCIGESSQFQTEQMTTGAEGEDCGGSGPDRNSHLQPDTDDKTSDCSEPDLGPLLGLNINTNNQVPERCSSGNNLCYCHECGEGFNSQEYLKKHLRVHSGEKPYSCLVCNKRFSSRGYVTVHMRLHTGEKSFKCPFCGKAFVRKEGLAQHVRLHTGEKPFSCRVCNKSFTWPAQVRQHRCTGESSQSETAEPPTCSSTLQMEAEADGESWTVEDQNQLGALQ